MPRYSLLIFDWDGTLADSAGHIVSSMQQAIAALSLPPRSDQAIRELIGLGLVDAMQRLFPELNVDDVLRLLGEYRRIAPGNLAHEAPLFAGAHDALRTLQEQGYLLAVATGKSRRGLDRALQSTALGAHFHASRCADEGLPKPHPDMLETLMRLLGVRRERTLMIGDTTHDLQMAANAGVPAVGLSHGAHPREELERLQPLACVGSFADLMRWLQQDA